MKSLLAILSLMLISSTVFSKVSSEQYPTISHGIAFTFEKLVSIISSNNIRSVEEALLYFPPSMRSNFVLIKDSHSLQKSDLLHPRAIMFGVDAKFVCSFGGSPDLMGYDNFECYQYRDETRSFDFREIVFPTKENGLSEVAISKSNRQAIGNTSCTTCHSDDPRPNWEPYPIWTGAYGFFDDSFNTQVGEIRYLPDLRKAVRSELKAFLDFKKMASESERYSQLIFSPSTYSPFSNKYKSTDYSLRPNLRFTLAITKLTAQRNARMLQQQPIETQYAYISAVMKCDTSKISDVLSPIYTALQWSPQFREIDARCNDFCKSLLPRQYAEYSFHNGSSDLNTHIVNLLVEDLVKIQKIPKESALKLDENHYDRNPICKFINTRTVEQLNLRSNL